MRSPTAARLDKKIPHRTALAAAIAWSICSASAFALPAPDVTAIEFYHSTTDVYRLTANPNEIATLDAANSGWKRTGGQLSAWKTAVDQTVAVPVCRKSQTGGTGTAFYSFNVADCAVPAGTTGWQNDGTAFYLARPASGTCPAGTEPIMSTFHGPEANRPASFRYISDPTAVGNTVARGYANGGTVFCAPLSDAQIEADITRFLEQATFGPTEALVATVKQKGIAAWLDEQFTLPASRFKDYAFWPISRPDTCVDNRTPPITPDSFCARDNYTLFPMQLEFYRQAMYGNDQLRQRVAFALSQILVTSGAGGGGLRMPYAMSRYQQMLRDHAFGTYENLLTKVTLSPVMGDYLDMANNNKGSATVNPNENYAREILQLFSIGTVKLNLDGTPVVNSLGATVPTYGQSEIVNYSKVFTGWTYPTYPGAAPRNNNPPYFIGDMIPVTANHDATSKTLLDGQVAPAGLTPEQDLANALKTVANHSNVAPFISKQLIQRLVTSNPTPAYVGRVAAVFNNNGAGVRGDLKAVVKAILLDPEARGSRKIDPEYGRLREPVLYLTNILRALNASTDGVYPRSAAQQMGQEAYNSPTVFNFYPPSHTLPGLSTLAPEFKILTTTTTLSRVNNVYTMSFGTIAPNSEVYGATGTTFNWSALQALAGDPGRLVDQLDKLLLHSTMSPAMKSAIVTAVSAIGATDTLGRTKAAVYLVASSSQYQIAR